MTIYRHYKNKYYRFHFTAKHSETLEDMVVYDCLYPNPLGTSWVRPHELFFGTTDLLDADQKPIPRFTLVKPHLQISPAVSEEAFHRLQSVFESSVGPLSEVRLRAKLKGQTRILLIEALWEGQWAGFKLGFEKDSNTFYSWIGAVREDLRGLGIGTELMLAQHNWCKENKYLFIETKTENRFKSMLLLNLRHGFYIENIDHANAQPGPTGSPIPPRIILKKTL